MVQVIINPPLRVLSSLQFPSLLNAHTALQLTQVPVPAPGPTELLVNIKYSGVCHSDLHAWKGGWPLGCKKGLIGRCWISQSVLTGSFMVYKSHAYILQVVMRA